MYHETKRYGRIITKIIILIIIIVYQAGIIESDGGDPPPRYLVTLEDATLYLYSTMNVSLREESISLDHPPLESQKNSDFENLQLGIVNGVVSKNYLMGLYLFINSQKAKSRYIKDVLFNNVNISVEINVNDPKISQMKIIYNGLYLLTIIKISKINFDLSEEGEKEFRKKFLNNEMSEIVNIIREYFIEQMKYDWKDVDFYLYDYNEVVSNHLILIEYFPRQNIVLYNDKDYQIDKGKKLIEVLSENNIDSNYYYFNPSFNILYLKLYIFKNPYEDTIENKEIMDSISLLAEFREVERVIRNIEEDVDQMERENIQILSNITNYQDFYDTYMKDKIIIRKSSKFLSQFSNYYTKYYEDYLIDYLISSDIYNIGEKLPSIQERLEIVEKDLEISKGIIEIREQTNYNKWMIFLNSLILFFTLIMAVSYFYSMRKSNTKKLELLEKNQIILLKRIKENLEKNYEDKIKHLEKEIAKLRKRRTERDKKSR